MTDIKIEALSGAKAGTGEAVRDQDHVREGEDQDPAVKKGEEVEVEAGAEMIAIEPVIGVEVRVESESE